MANRWTPAQQEALDTRNKNLLLSAAAGSGKTAVLTERITRIAGDMESGIDINELLVLTFTKAAAAEMKSRVSASLTNKLREADAENNLPLIHHLERQLSLMGSAQISTLDSFFQSLLRQYFYLLDLDPKTQIMADENEGYLLKEAVQSSFQWLITEKEARDYSSVLWLLTPCGGGKKEMLDYFRELKRGIEEGRSVMAPVEAEDEI